MVAPGMGESRPDLGWGRAWVTGCSLLAVALLLAATAQAVVVSRVGDMETGAASPFDFDQITTQCPTSVAARETALGYSGSSSLIVHTENDPACEGAYARGIIREEAPNHLLEGDELSIEAAVFLPSGFYEAHSGYTDLIRADSYVRDDGSNTPFADRAEINFASWDNDEIHVRAARGGSSANLIGPLPPSVLPEGSWNLVELHLRLGAIDGSALTELRINDQLLGSSASANLFAGAEPLNRVRFGIVSTNSTGSGNLTAYFDRATIRDIGTSPEPKPGSPPAPEEPGPPDDAGPPEEPGENAPEEPAEGAPSNPVGDESGEAPTKEPNGQLEGEPPASDSPGEITGLVPPIEEEPPPREAEEPAPAAPEAPDQEVRAPEAPTAKPTPIAAGSGQARANLGLPSGPPTFSRHFKKRRASKRARRGCARRRGRAARRRARSRSIHRRRAGACGARCRDRGRCCGLLARRPTRRSQRSC